MYRTTFKTAKNISASEALMEKFKEHILSIPKNYIKLARDDPRRVNHALKVALTLTLVSSTYYDPHLYRIFDVDGIWAVITVVVLSEFTAGATISKGLNRGIATFVAGALGLIAVKLGHVLGHKLGKAIGHHSEDAIQGVYIGISVAIYGAFGTFTRFFPKIKARYDYGCMISVLTFSMVAVTGYRKDLGYVLSYWRRFATVVIGGVATMLVSVIVFPVWAGDDLHNTVASNLEKVAKYLEGFGYVYFQSNDKTGVKIKEDKPLPCQYKSVFNSKGKEDLLAVFASWEPYHGRFGLLHPWGQYLKIGALTRDCASLIDALNNHVNSDIQRSQEFQMIIQEGCKEMSRECSNTLKELAASIITMTKPKAAGQHLENAKYANNKLQASLEKSTVVIHDLLSVIPPASVASILMDIVKSVEKIAKAVSELAVQADFGPPIEFTVQFLKPDGTSKTVVNSLPIYRLNLLPRQFSTNAYPDPENGGWN